MGGSSREGLAEAEEDPYGALARVVSAADISLSRLVQLLIPNDASSFLNDIDRITQRDYEPSDDDIVRARLRTVGVQEYKLVMEKYGKYAPCLAVPPVFRRQRLNGRTFSSHY